MEALSEKSSFSRESGGQDEGRYASGNLILWIAAIAVLVGLNFASWSFCMWVFGQPEHPMNYRLLTRLDKLDPIRGFSPVSAPRGKFYSAKDLYAQVYPFNVTELRAYNGILKRHYLKNYKERDDVVYLSGEFTVDSVEAMGEGDVFQSGLVIRGRSTTFPDVVLDLALPSVDVPEFFELGAGDTIRVEESTTCAALLNVERLPDESMIFTVVPLVTMSNATPPEPKSFEFGENSLISVSTPQRIQLEPELWPISDGAERIEKKPVNLSEEDSEGTAAAEPDSQPEAAGGE
tara:strand:- start:1557 stop:2429 length:873 start_codon:yes stop_codon:yes gene_type:complete